MTTSKREYQHPPRLHSPPFTDVRQVLVLEHPARRGSASAGANVGGLADLGQIKAADNAA